METIRIRLKDYKWYEVDGERVGETFAVTPGISDKHEYMSNLWQVTHMPTGATTGDSKRKATALAIANALVELGFDGVQETDVTEAVKKLRKRGDIGGFVMAVRDTSPEEVARVASRFARARRVVPKAVPVKVPRTPKATKASKPTKKPQAPPDLLALARAARRGTL